MEFWKGVYAYGIIKIVNNYDLIKKCQIFKLNFSLIVLPCITVLKIIPSTQVFCRIHIHYNHTFCITRAPENSLMQVWLTENSIDQFMQDC